MLFQRFNERLKEYFTFTRKERNGILILLALIFIMQAAIIYTHFMEPVNGEIKFQKFEKELLAFENELNIKENVIGLAGLDTIASDSSSNTAIVLFDFDPNLITAQKWKQLGLDSRTIHSITNYLSKGGRFRKKEDLKKIYTLKERDFLRLEPFIVIEETVELKKEVGGFKEKYADAKKQLPIVELNNASMEELMSLPMIGEKRAIQIIKYRDLLGGFVKKEQLKEVYSIPDSIYQLVVPGVSVNTKLIRPININADSISSLKHLYIRQPIAKLIVNYRLQHGDYHSVEELRKLPLMSDSLFKKIEHYLVIE